MEKKRLIIIVGPTAAGKTGLAVRLAEHFHSSIISADSRQVYRELNVGVARPSMEELKRVPHYFVASQSITESFDAGAYGREARARLESIFEEHDTAILCGGSGLYVKAVLEGLDEMPPTPSEVRASIIADYQSKGLLWLQKELGRLDPDYFEVVDRQNPQRIMRALEIIRATGKPYSDLRTRNVRPLPYQLVKIGLSPEREELYRRIHERMDMMIASGLFEEAKQLLPLRHLNALQTVGYQEVFGFLLGEYDREEAIRLLKQNSRNYAKRQLTWFRRDKEIQWFDSGDWEAILKHCAS